MEEDKDQEWFKSDPSDPHHTSPFVPPPVTNNISRVQSGQQSNGVGIEGLISDDSLQGRLAREMYGKGREKAQGFINFYANIDLIRPYFDVEPVDVAKRWGNLLIYQNNVHLIFYFFFFFRLLFSLVPYRKRELKSTLPFFGEENLELNENSKKADLYGPLMICFTLSAILLLGIKLQMEAQTTNFQEGTLLSTALFVCFIYWFISSVVYYFLGFMFNSELGFLQILSYSVFLRHFILRGFFC